MAKKLGVRTPLDVNGGYVPAIGLGAMDVSPLDMASAYATLAGGGIYSEPMAIRKVVLPTGEDKKAGWGKPKRKRVIPDGVAYEVTRILEQNVQYGTGTAANFGHPAAGKTGTTEEHSDAWFCGYTPRLGTTVWVGYPKGKIPMENVHGISVAGGTFPAQIWRLFMSSAIGGLEPVSFTEPTDWPEWTDFVRGTEDRSYGYTQDDDDENYAPPASTPDPAPAESDDTGARSGARGDRGAAGAARLAQESAPADAPAARRPADRSLGVADTAARASGRAALLAAVATALLVAGCAVCAWIERAPLVPAAAGRADGGTLGRVFLACLVAAFLVYLAALALLRRRPPALRPVLAAAFAIQLVPLAAPLLLSTDAWTYWEYGRIAVVHDGNPYLDTPDEFPADPSYEYAGAAWRDTTSVYGPAFTLLSEAVALVSGSSAAAAAWIYKVLAAVGVLACVLLATRLAHDRPLAAALVGWNPLLAIHFAGGGHNDSLLIALTLGAIVLAAAGRKSLAGAAWALAILIKWIPLVFFALRAIEARTARRRVGHVAFAATAVLVLAAATWRYGLDWVRAAGPLTRNAEEQSSYALPHRLEQLGVPHWLVLVLAVAALALGLAWLAREAHRGRVHLGLAGCLLLATTPWLTPWYVIWALPFAAAEDDRRAQLLALAFCAYLLPQTVPLASSAAGRRAPRPRRRRAATARRAAGPRARGAPDPARGCRGRSGAARRRRPTPPRPGPES